MGSRHGYRVNYRDEFAVGLNGLEAPVVLILSRSQTIENAKLEQKRTLTFTLHTSFPILYSLTLSEDGRAMTGTAKTPKGTNVVVWNRLR